jgi:hypothetical protein
MSRASAARRAVAEIRWEGGARTVAWVGDRSVHHYWTLLSAYFRDVLLPPHRRAEENGVSWSWREDEDPAPVTASELRTLRKTLTEEQQMFAESLAGGGLGRRGAAAGLKGQMNVEQLGAVMAGVVAGLVERSDDALRGYVCRTESGLRLHSWGADAPARPSYPDTSGLEISGRVLVGGKPARHDVVLESSDGETITEVPSDDSGEFRFSKLSPGEYRLRARTLRGTFPPHGLPVNLGRNSVTDVVLADARAETVSPLVTARRRSRRRSYRTPLIAAVLVLGTGGAIGWWLSQPSGTATVATQKVEDPSAPSDGAAPATPRGSVSAPPGLRPDAGGPASAPAPVAPVRKSPGGASPAGSLATSAPADAPLPVNGHLSREASLPPALAGLPVAAKGQPGAAGAAAPASAAGAAGSPAAGNGAGPGDGASAAPANAAPSPAAAASSSASGGSAGAGSPVAAASPPPPAATAVTAAAVASLSSVPVPPVAPVEPAGTPAAATPAGTFATEPSSAEPAREPVALQIPDTASVRTDAASARPEPAAPAPLASSDREATTTAVAPGRPTSNSTPDAGSPGSTRSPVPTASPAETPANVAASSVPEYRPPEARSLLRAVPAPLTRTVRVRVAPWRPRLLGDSILPTAPVPMRQAESVGELRARLLAGQQARLPGAFREPRGRVGVVIEWTETSATETLSWTNEAGAPADRGRVDGGKAEIAWEPTDAGQTFRLRRSDRAVVAEVQVTAAGREFTVRTTDDARAWLQLSVATRGSEPAVSTLSWRTGTGAPMPTTWRQAEVDTGRPDASVLLPLGSASGAAALQAGALFDAGSGWALVTEVRQAADRPLGE